MSVENLFVDKLEESHKNSVYLFIFWLKVIILIAKSEDWVI